VINPENRVFRKNGQGYPVQFAGGSKISPKGFFNDDSGIVSEPGGPEIFDNRFKKGWGNREIMNGPLVVAQCLFELLERTRVVIIANDLLEQGKEPAQRVRIVNVSRICMFNRVRSSFPQLIDIPGRGGHADDGHIEQTFLYHCI
jgi:hypothetical protein